MTKRPISPRLRHFVILIPGGLLVGVIVGLLFHDPLFGLLSGIGLGVLIATLFALQTH